MLILSRKIGESIIIDDVTRVTVLENDGSNVRIGIEAPRDVEVWRKEIWDTHQNGEAEEADDDFGNR